MSNVIAHPSKTKLPYSWPSMSVGSTSRDSNRSKILGKKCHVVADMYYVVKSQMVMSVQNMHKCYFLIP